VYIAAQAVWIGGHFFYGFIAIGFKDAKCPAGTDPVTVQKHHYCTNLLLLLPGSSDLSRPDRAYAVDIRELFRSGVDNLKHFLAEMPDQPAGKTRTYAFYKAGSQVFFYTFLRVRRGCSQNLRLELLAMLPVYHPGTVGLEPLAGPDLRQYSQYCHEIAMPS